MAAARKSSRAKNAKARRLSRRLARRRALGWTLAVLSLICMTVLLTWLYRLDQRVSAAFEGVRWAVPGRIYARPLELYTGRMTNAQALVAELMRLGYRRTSTPHDPGSFAASDTRVQFVTRDFSFPDGARPSQSLRVGFRNNRINAIADASGRAIDVIRLEPQLLGSTGKGAHEDRRLISLNDAPPALIESLLVVEDRSFFTHTGVDPRGIARAALANIRAKRVVQGGSTITQQLVKSYYLDARRTLERKLTEATMAVLLERRYTKHQILEAYLNEVYLGQSGNRAIHGFGLGSQFYFGRPLDELSLSEIALLVGMVRGPSIYNPRRYPERALARRNRVLAAVAAEAGLNAHELAALKEQGLGVIRDPGHATGHPAFAEFVKRETRLAYTPRQMDETGHSVFTTLDPQIQQIAERSLAAGLAGIEKKRNIKPGTLEGAVVVVRIDNGEVLAVVGGRKPGFAGFNRALDARRPIGSLIKPAVYLTALEQAERYTLATRLIDERFSITDQRGEVWSPDNYTRKTHGEVALIDSLAHSYNLSTARLGLELGVSRVRDTIQRLGIAEPGPAYPSMLLGAVEASPMAVAQLYQSLSNQGLRAPLRAVVGVVSQSGAALPRQGDGVLQVTDPGSAALVVRALEEVIRTGTGRSVAARFAGAQLPAGKTGTTNDFRDSWFAGFQGNVLAVVWVGRDDNEPTGLTGATGALQIWTDLLTTLSPAARPVPPPPDVTWATIDPVSGLLGDGNCPGARELPFIEGSEPEYAAPCAGFSIARPVKRIFGGGFRRLVDALTGRDDGAPVENAQGVSLSTEPHDGRREPQRARDTSDRASTPTATVRELNVEQRPSRQRDAWNVDDSNR